jgi:hypothetical protein
MVHTSVLDSPAPLSGDFLLNRLDSYSLSLSRIFEYCANTPECNKEYPELKADYFKAIAHLEKSPLKVTLRDSIPFVINAQDGVYLIRRLYIRPIPARKPRNSFTLFSMGRARCFRRSSSLSIALPGV